MKKIAYLMAKGVCLLIYHRCISSLGLYGRLKTFLSTTCSAAEEKMSD